MFVDHVSESPILSLIDRIFEMRRKGESVLGLHIGEPDFDTPHGIRRAAAEAMDAGMTHYVSAQGMPELREGVAAYARRAHRIPAAAEDVVVLPAKFAIYATLLSTIAPGDEVLLPDPTYLFEQPVELAGARPVYFPLDPSFRLDLDALERAITPRSRLLFLVSPGNPTGQLLEREELGRVLDIARRRNLVVVSDETYASLVYDGPHVAAASIPDAFERVVTVGSFSKMFAMTGWRAGFAIAPPAIRARLVKVMEHTLTCLPPFIQRACTWALENALPDAERFRSIFRSRRDRLVAALGSVPGLSLVRPRGAFYVFPSYDLATGSLDFCQRLLAEEKLAVVPGLAFGPAGERHIRISYSSPDESLDEGVRRLRRFMERHRPRG